MNVQPALVVEGLWKSFGTLDVLRGIDLTMAEHEIVCVIGASGSGKSTLLRCINLTEPIDGGRIVVKGEEITADGVDVDRIRRRIGIVFQAFNLFPHMSVLENVTLHPGESCGAQDRRPMTRRPRCSSASAWPTSGSTTPIGSRAANNSALRSCARWPWTPTCSCSTR